MKICLVTTFPPSTGGLSEYGFHIAKELQRNPYLSLTVLADELPQGHVEPEGFTVQRCWSFDDPRSVVRLTRTIQRLKPDVVWFNLLFSTFGRSPLVAFSGLMTPLLARLGGRYTHVTLHHLMDTVDLKDAGIRYEWLYRSAGAVATRMLLLANSVSVLMPGYRKILNDKYGRDNVHLRSHGILARRPEFPDLSRRGNPTHRILAFGKWGTYKRLELMIEAFGLLAAKVPDVKLVIAGGDHPNAAGYTESMKQACAGDSRIEFRGYVPEDDLEEMFQGSSVAVMPYSSSTGCSGVAHLACAYGVPIICADIGDFRQMAAAEELAIEFYPPGNAEGLAECLAQFLQDPVRQQMMAGQNFSAALRMTMPNVVQKYLRQFEVQQRTQALRYVSRFRRLPSWVPSKSLLLRFMTRNSLSWARRSAILHTSWNGRDDLRSLNGNGDGGRKLGGAGTAANGDGIAAGGSRRSNGLADGLPPSAGRATDNQGGQDAGSDEMQNALALHLADESEPKRAKGEEPGSEQGITLAGVSVAGNGSSRNGKNGTASTAPGSNGSGSELASQGAGQTGTGEINRIIESAGLRHSGDRDISGPA
jgi:glycosyltransferase involved in cell wall biosynthesis